jgi:broad specificity phosphatase PhoE
LQRTSQLISKLERIYKNNKILLVSHGDTLQILQCAFQKQPASKHRTLSHLEVGEIRELLYS